MRTTLAVSALLALAVAMTGAGRAAQEETVIGALFGEWHMSCALNASIGSKSCSIWAGPVSAKSPLGGTTPFTLLVDPETPYATIATRSALFVKMQIDDGKAILVDCSKIGICELSRDQAGDLVQEASRGENLLIRMALPNGTYDRSLLLSGYRAAFANFLEEQRLYELKMHPGDDEDG